MKRFFIPLIIVILVISWYFFIPRNKNKEIVVVIPSFNNKEWYERNLHSVFMQKHTHYRVLYIDDCSTDGTYDLVNAYIKKNNQEHRVRLIRNTQRKGALENLYQAIHSCPDDAIIVTLDGDDWFKDEYVLAKIDEVYKDPNVWLTYGQYEVYPDNALGICHAIPDQIIKYKAYRQYEWVTSHPRTFYAWLFKKVKKEDLQIDGHFFETAWDQAFMFPMLEMAGSHIQFIPDILYVYNQANPLNDFKLRLRQQMYYSWIIRNKSSYTPVEDEPRLGLLRS
jgi:glycosyltransferase involved in cell wall biosynthesis